MWGMDQAVDSVREWDSYLQIMCKMRQYRKACIQYQERKTW